MDTLFATSPDGMHVAYDRNGTGPALVLLHGGGSRRQEWHDAGYVKRLQDDFTVITLDLRGHGESTMPVDPADYTIDKMLGDVLAVADACGIERFSLWGFSFGGKVSRYLAAQSGRVNKAILMGATLGTGAPGQLRQDIVDFCAHWPPILQAQRNGKLDRDSLSQDDQDFLQNFNVPVMLAWGRAMLDWPVIEPADFRCPTLWLVGSEDQNALDSVREYEQSLKGSRVQLQMVEGLNHEQVFEEIDRVFPTLLAFMQS
jgi:pimeloyl-ACP methyl ester carboxylesterase